MTELSQYIRPLANKQVAELEAIDNGFLVRFHEPIERRKRTGRARQMEEEMEGQMGYVSPAWATREVVLYCPGVEEVKAAVERATTEYARISDLYRKGELEHSGHPPF